MDGKQLAFTIAGGFIGLFISNAIWGPKYRPLAGGTMAEQTDPGSWGGCLLMIIFTAVGAAIGNYLGR